MIHKFQVSIIVQKPINEVFDGVYNPKKISSYFTTAGASAPLEQGTTVQWEFADFPGPFPVKTVKTVTNKNLIFEWGAADGDYNTTVEFTFESLNTEETKVMVSEWGWKETQQGLENSYSNCMGWSQMLCALKAYLEYGINLRKGAYKALKS
jgi:Uncharacterized conserved protein